jgi:acyl-CoA synthetase (AMP-forming)/AMP-acid ligase II
VSVVWDAVAARGDEVVLVESGEPFSGRRLLDEAERILAAVQDGPAGRAAAVFGATAPLIAALMACERADVELVCLRDASHALPPDLAVDGVTLDGWLPQGGEPAAERSGFHVLIASSGTTGPPKLARHTLARLLGRVRTAGPDAASRRWLLTYHPATFAGLQVILTALTDGGRLYALVPDASSSELATYAAAQVVTHISATPTFWRTFCATLGPAAAETPLRVATLGGERSTQATLDLVRRSFPQAKIAHIFASTETGALFSVTDGREGFPAAWLETGVDGVRLRVSDGLLEVQSPRSMLGYAHDTGAAEGWVATGDLVELDGDRVLFAGRLGRTLNIGGAKVDPEEVEGVLQEAAGVVDAHVYGRANPITGMLVAADVVLEKPADREESLRVLREHASRRLERHKVPRVITVVDRIVARSGKKTRA